MKFNVEVKDLLYIRECYLDQIKWLMDNYKPEIADYIAHLENEIIEINIELIKRGEVK